MTVAIFPLQVAQELLNVIDVVVQVKFAFGQGHHTGVFPVGDVHLVPLQHGANRVAKQSGVVTRKGGNHQHHRLVLEVCQGFGVIRKALETAQLTERFVEFNTFMNGYLDTLDVHRGDAKGGFLVIFGQTVKQLVGGGHALGKRGLLNRQTTVAVQPRSGHCEVGERLHDGALCFINLIKHVRKAFLLQCNITASAPQYRSGNYGCRVTIATRSPMDV